MKRVILFLLLSILLPSMLCSTIVIAGHNIVKASSDGTTLTFLIVNSQKEASAGVEIQASYSSAPSWCSTKVKKVVFDSSFSNGTFSSTAYWLSGCPNLTTIEGLEYLNTNKLTTADCMFDGCSSLTTIDLSHLNPQNLKSCRNMFQNCSKLKTIYGTKWDITSNMTNEEKTKFLIYQAHHSAPYMFNGCNSLVGGSGTKYDATLVNDYTYCHVDGGTTDPGYFTMKGSAVVGAYGVEYKGTLTLYYDKMKNARAGEKYDFVAGQKPGWSGSTSITKVVIDPSMKAYSLASVADLFSNCYELKSIEGLSNLNTGKAADMSRMFANCCSLESIDLSVLNTNTITSMSQLFYQCFSLKSVTLKISTSRVTDLSEVFYDCFNLTTLDLGNFNTAKVTTMKKMFYNCRKLKSLNVSSFNTANVTDMSGMMANLCSLSSINLNHFNTSKVTDMSYMFGDNNPQIVKKPNPTWYSYRRSIWDNSNVPATSTVNSIDITNFNTANVTDMNGMFWGCNSLKSLELRNFNTTKVTNMGYMFSECTQLATLNIGTFRTDNVTSFIYMFSGCENLSSIDVSAFSTAKATSLNSMFSGCSKLKTLYLGGFTNPKVTDMSSMFNGCSTLKTIYVQDSWSTVAVTSSTAMFTGCTNLVGGNGTKFNSGKTDKTYARIDVAGTAGYLTNQVSTIPGGKQAYAVIDGTTMTFYYDNKASNRTGSKYLVSSNSSATNPPAWIYDNKRLRVRKAVFDSSFSVFRPTSTAYWFYLFASLVSIEGLSNLNTSAVTSMAEMFRYCYVLPNLDLSTFDTRNVTDMSCMFCYCWALTNINLSSFNTSKVTTMTHLFHQCPISSVDVSTFDTQHVTDMSIMFAECKNLKNLNLKNFKTDKVTDMSFMFIYNPSLTTIEVTDKWSTSSVQRSNDMFCDNYKLVGSMGTKYDPQHIDHEYAQIDGGLCDPGYLSGEKKDIPFEAYVVIDNNIMTFYYDSNYNCYDNNVYKIEEDYYFKDFGHRKLPAWSETNDVITKAVFDQSFAKYHPTTTSGWLYRPYRDDLEIIEGISYLNTDMVTDMSAMFASCTKLKTLNLSQFITENVKSMAFMFYNCDSLRNINVSTFKTTKVTDMQHMFFSCDSLRTLDVSNFDTRNVTNMKWMFGGCKRIPKLDLKNFDTTNVTDMSYMFCECYGLVSLDISSFDTSKVTDMRSMFEDITLSSINVTHFNTSNVVDMTCMFCGCHNLKSLDLRNFDTRNVKRMDQMFLWDDALTTLNLSNFNTTNVKFMQSMFDNCRALISVDLSNFSLENIDGEFGLWNMFARCSKLQTIYVCSSWNLDGITNGGAGMFNDCISLIGGKGTKYDENYEDQTYARIDGGSTSPGYFTYKVPGDINGDGKFDTSDLKLITDYIMKGESTGIDKTKVDLNGDGVVNVTDVVWLVNIIKSR